MRTGAERDESRAYEFSFAASSHDASSAWELANGRRCRILTTQDDSAWVFAMQHASGRIDDGGVERPSVQTYLSDDGLTAAQARRLGRALIEAAKLLDELTR